MNYIATASACQDKVVRCERAQTDIGPVFTSVSLQSKEPSTYNVYAFHVLFDVRQELLGSGVRGHRSLWNMVSEVRGE